jgi:glycerol-3-phosphate dehydrogenase
MGCVWFTQDGRVLYLLPWEGSTIAGTTDIKDKPSMNPTPVLSEVDFILRECNTVLSRPINHSHVRAAWAGLRPLVRDPSADPNDTKKLARDHVVDIVRGNLISICGGKWTTYRRMAEDAVDAALGLNASLAPSSACQTETMQLLGTDRGGLICHKNFDKVVVTLREKYDMDKLVAKHLMHNYGTRALIVADIAREYASNDSGQGVRYLKLYSKYPMLEAEVVFACRSEWACTAVDVLARRTRLAFLDSHAAEKALPRVLDIMQKELGWSGRRKEQERKSALAFLETMSMPSQ